MFIFKSLNKNDTILDFSKTNNEFYISEKRYKYEMVHKVRPFLEKYIRRSHFYTRDNLRIYYERYINPKAEKAVVISHGMGECTAKMEEVIYYFFKAGYSVFIMDHRGHGNSDREIKDLTIVYIDDFEKYIVDFYEFMKNVVFLFYKECYLYAHSMGGGIGAAFIEQYPKVFKKAVLTSPMIEMNTFIPKWLLKLIIKVGIICDKNKESVFPNYTFTSVQDFQKFCSTAKLRADYYYSKILMNERYNTYGISFSWLKSSLKGTSILQKKANASKIKTKVLILQAEDDCLVKNKAMNKFAIKIEEAEVIFVPNVKHELYNTYNDVMIPYFNTIFDFFKKE